jgi:hypothetical protein
VFALLFINRLAVRGAGFDFEQGDLVRDARAAIACDLLAGAIDATDVKQHGGGQPGHGGGGGSSNGNATQSPRRSQRLQKQ